MISTPHSSSPWIAALSHTVGPSSFPWTITTGKATGVPETSFAIGNSSPARLPAGTVVPAITKSGRGVGVIGS